MVESNSVNPTGVRNAVRHLPPLMEMARRFRASLSGWGERTLVRLRRLPLSRHTGRERTWGTAPAASVPWGGFTPTCEVSARASCGECRVGGAALCVLIHEVKLAVMVGVVVGVVVGRGEDGCCVQHGESHGRSGARTILTALDGDGSPPLPRLGVRMG